MSQLNEIIHAVGELDIVLTGPDGKVKESVHVPNTVMTVGKSFIAARMVQAGIPTQMTHMAIGSGETDPVSPAYTTLSPNGSGSNELGRVALTGGEGVAASNVITYVASFPAGTGTGAVTEAAIFNAASAGSMLCRTVFGAINKGVNDTLNITWTVTIN